MCVWRHAGATKYFVVVCIHISSGGGCGKRRKEETVSSDLFFVSLSFITLDFVMNGWPKLLFNCNCCCLLCEEIKWGKILNDMFCLVLG